MNLSFPQMPDKLTSTEQDIVEYIAAHRDEFLCMTIGQLSAALHISEATVSRFARHVGCEDFKHLTRTVVEQTVRRGPAQKLNYTLRTGDGDLLTAWMEQQRYNLQKTLDLRRWPPCWGRAKFSSTPAMPPAPRPSCWNTGCAASGWR